MSFGKSRRSRDRLDLVRETLDICEQGRCVGVGGVETDISCDLLKAVAGTRVYCANDSVSWQRRRVPLPPTDEEPLCTYSVLNCTTISAAHLLASGTHQVKTQEAAAVDEDEEEHEPRDGLGVGCVGGSASRGACDVGDQHVESEAPSIAGVRNTGEVAVLNFASGRRPGGGFVKGGVAQEEDNCLCSGLFMCLSQDDPQVMSHYEGNSLGSKHGNMEAGGAKLYTDSIIYSRDVPVFRNGSTYQLLDQPFFTSVISAPAVNCRHQSQHHRASSQSGDVDEVVRRAMHSRMRRILAVAAFNGHSKLVLGAFGCGVFQGDAEFVARTWMELLEREFRGVFSTVIFAVLDDRANDQSNNGSFGGTGNSPGSRSTFDYFESVVALCTGVGAVQEPSSRREESKGRGQHRAKGKKKTGTE